MSNIIKCVLIIVHEHEHVYVHEYGTGVMSRWINFGGYGMKHGAAG
jgi:hypothetical protein